ncbi:tigger transposable element-derived protein 4-like, partial [Galendromus occidentalis]|uniref:Tigger transposable element-derived protein 4-like n=1 Tax=Galendromus occidentalis TaxID=34638 RepID=A0AAJ7SJ27_9ACAR
FFRALPNKSLIERGKECQGGKMAKERLSIALCCSATGEKFQPLAIWKALNPRCFKGHDVKRLGVFWEANAKAWMTTSIFESWLSKFNAHMERQNRRVLLMLDNAPCHGRRSLSHVGLLFLPPNVTSELQPLDQGIIQAFKLQHRGLMLEWILSKMDNCLTATELSKKINVLEAIQWVSRAWKSVKEETIVGCFRRCGIKDDNQMEKVPAVIPEAPKELPQDNDDIAAQLKERKNARIIIYKRTVETLRKILETTKAESIALTKEIDALRASLAITGEEPLDRTIHYAMLVTDAYGYLDEMRDGINFVSTGESRSRSEWKLAGQSFQREPPIQSTPLGHEREEQGSVDEGLAGEVEAIVVPDETIPEDLFVGRTFLDLPHFSLARFEDQFFVGPAESILNRIRRARTERPSVVDDVEIGPGTAALVQARTAPSSTIVVRAQERDFVYHSNAEGMVQLPIENRGWSSLRIRAGERLGRCKVLAEDEFG